MAYRSITDNFFWSRGVRRLPCREAKWLYDFLIRKAGTYGIFQTEPEFLRQEYEFTPEEWQRAFEGLTSPAGEAAPRLYFQEENRLFFLREQFDEQVIQKGFLSPKHKVGLKNCYEKIPTGIVKTAFLERYGPIFGEEIPKKTKSKKKPPEKDGVFQTVQSQIYETWRNELGSPPNWSNGDGSLLKTLLSRQEPALITDAWTYYLKNPDDWCLKNGQSFKNFFGGFDKTISRLKAAALAAPQYGSYEKMAGKDG